MKYTYHFTGTVHPSRTGINFHTNFISPDGQLKIFVSVKYANISAVVYTDLHFTDRCDADSLSIFDLKNDLRDLISQSASIFGYLLGRYYDVEITRAINPEIGLDIVFGIAIPCLENRIDEGKVDHALKNITLKLNEQFGHLLRRAFDDLASSMKHPIDTAFYCYRAIETLRLHSAYRNNLENRPKIEQWIKFREESSISKEDIDEIKLLADPIRHGEIRPITDIERKALFLTTWDIVDKYLAIIPAAKFADLPSELKDK